jgi:hypothetical protein
MARFNNNMFQFEDFDMSGIMNPELVDVMEMRKEANLARGNATDQYEADVADFKDTQATEAEQGIASLPDSPNNTNAQNYYDPTLFGYDINLPDNITAEDFQFEDIDMTGMVPDMPIYTNPYAEVFDNVVNTGLPEAEDSVTYTPPVSNDTGETTPYVPPDEIPDYPFIDPETGGDYVFIVGDPTNPGPGVVVRDPETGELPPGFSDEGVEGPAGTILPEVYTPPPAPAPTPAPIMNPYTNRPVKNPYQVFEQPTTTSSYTRPMTADVFGGSPGITKAPLATYAGLDSTSYDAPTAPQLAASLAPFLPPDDDTATTADDTATTPPGMNQGGRVPMGNNNMLNSGLSRLPLNQQNDTLTQVFQSGFRPRR